jgi:1-deoxy-D-xylulose-5-phosphate reductoisomerase
MNAANEVAVDAFLNHEISFGEIVTACQEIVEQHNFDPNPTLDELFAADRWARQEMSRWMFA